MEYLKTRVTQVRYPEEGYALIWFKGDKGLCGYPGQFVMVRGDWGNDPILGRAFSLLGSGDEEAILVRIVGAGTRRLAELKPGDPLWALGPSGHGFSMPAPDQAPVLVAGGVGVAPLFFLAKKIHEKGGRATVLYGARNNRELPLSEELEELADLVVTTEDGSAGRRGLVTEPLKEILEDTAVSRVVYSCGPEPMLEAVARACVDKQVDCQIALESPMACGKGTCKGCAVLAADGRYSYVCSDGPVFESRDIYGS